MYNLTIRGLSIVLMDKLYSSFSENLILMEEMRVVLRGYYVSAGILCFQGYTLVSMGDSSPHGDILVIKGNSSTQEGFMSSENTLAIRIHSSAKRY